jgi:hypothetical protein
MVQALSNVNILTRKNSEVRMNGLFIQDGDTRNSKNEKLLQTLPRLLLGVKCIHIVPHLHHKLVPCYKPSISSLHYQY